MTPIALKNRAMVRIRCFIVMISLFVICNVVSLFVICVVLLFVLRNVVFVSSAKIPLFKKVDKRTLRFLLHNVVFFFVITTPSVKRSQGI